MSVAAAPARMRAVVWPARGEPLAVRELPVPALEGPDDLLLRVRTAMFGAALIRAVTLGHPKHAPPAVLGTLVCGEVVERGVAVEHVEVGDLVTLDPHPPCGACAECRDGVEALCSSRWRVEPGAHAEFVRVPGPLATAARRVPEGLDADAAVLTEIVACVLDATRLAAIPEGGDVVVVGCGLVAMIQVQAALRAGAGQVICTVNHPERAALVESFGAVPVEAAAAEQEVLDRTGGRGGHAVVEAVGRAQTYEQALRLVRAQGTVVAFGGCPPGTSVALDVNDLHYRRIRLLGSYHYRRGTFDEALEALSRGEIDVAPLITHRLTLEEAAGAVEIVRGERCLAVLVRP